MPDLKAIHGTRHFDEMDTLHAYVVGQNDPACFGCFYYRRLSYNCVQRCCHYCLDTYQCRPCPPGAECTVRRSVEEDKPFFLD